MGSREMLMSKSDDKEPASVGLQPRSPTINPSRPVDVVQEGQTSEGTIGVNLQQLIIAFTFALGSLLHLQRASLRAAKTPQVNDGRRIDLGALRREASTNGRTTKLFANNTIRSSRYTPLNFLPRQLIAQFSKLGNFYFLCVSIVQLIPSVSTTGRYTTLVPLLIFVGISIMREALDDLGRLRLDKEENNRPTLVFHEPQANAAAEEARSATSEPWSKSKWQDIKVGDLLRILEGQTVPADVVLLHVDGVDGLAYIETMALDGETNHKSRQAPPHIAPFYNHASVLSSLNARFVVEDPNPDLYKFEGQVRLADEVIPLTNNEIIYRGSILRNTRHVIALAIFTGEECKIRMNATKSPRIKAPALQAAVNKVVILTVFVVIALSLLNTIAYRVWKTKVGKHAFYLSHAGVAFFQLLASFFLMFNPIIPLALYISLEIVKSVQMGQMANDIELYDEQSDTPMEPRTSTIHEDLGQVSYIFSDKTGTLTRNSMRFRKMSVAGTVWLHDVHSGGDETNEESDRVSPRQPTQWPDEAKQAISVGVAVPNDSESCPTSPSNDCRVASPRAEENSADEVKPRNGDSHGDTKELLERIRSKPHTALAQNTRLFLLAIALCHTCLPRIGLDGKLDFQGLSVDEIALVAAARELGHLVLKKNPSSITIRLLQSAQTSTYVDETYGILDMIDFSSDRRRMSVVIRMPDGRICVFCKGAESVLQHRLRIPATTAKTNPAIKLKEGERTIDGQPLDATAITRKCFDHLNDFASEGLRTLIYAYRYIDESTYETWRASYREASISLINRQSLIESVGEQLEQDLELLGATGIEDRLQEGVSETIDRLRRANIKTWMSTGDKRETAINVGRACGLIKSDSTLIVLDDGLAQPSQRISTALTNFKDGHSAHTVVIVDGQALSNIETQPTDRDFFLELAVSADSVICCRATPSQKASLITCVRKHLPKSITLAIGDGANDIAMIQAAHVGIGITGYEGRAAARASDYSIAQFRFLSRLLLVHGRWNYMRTCKYVLGTFWKEMMFYLTQALFQCWNGWTGTSLYEPWSVTLFQPLFTSAPVVCMGIFEKDLAASTLLAVPELYSQGQRNGGFNMRIYAWWMFMAACDAVIIFFTMLGLYGEVAITRDDGVYAAGALTYTACVIIISLKMQVLELHNKTPAAAVAVIFSLGAWFIWMLAISAAYTDNTIYNVKDGLLVRFGRDGAWWLALIAIVFAVMLFELVVATLRRSFWPTDVDVLQEIQRESRR